MLTFVLAARHLVVFLRLPRTKETPVESPQIVLSHRNALLRRLRFRANG
jgi:hypothetical protein